MQGRDSPAGAELAERRYNLFAFFEHEGDFVAAAEEEHAFVAPEFG
jgi:hypothetical protein